MSEIAKRWLCHTGQEIALSADVPLTMYNGLNHDIAVWEGGTVGQMLTRCGLRACPYPRLREVPGRGPVDCPGCLDAGASPDSRSVRTSLTICPASDSAWTCLSLP